MMDGEKRKRFENAHYGIVGHHSAVQICGWTKKALRGKGACYKQHFYGVDCYRCAQMSPAFAWCEENCLHCWRPAEWMSRTEIEEPIDDPDYIIDETVKKRRELLSGIGGAFDVNEKAFKISFSSFPSHWAISLSGEPTLYPRIGELVLRLRERKVSSIFIVTNGQEPSRIEEMRRMNSLPTQLYLSLNAPNEKMFKELNRPRYHDGWRRLHKTAEMLASLPCRTVIRFTLIRGINDLERFDRDYANFFKTALPDFIEIKSYIHLGLSRKRLKNENMAPYEHVYRWAKRILKEIPYKLENGDERSRVVLLKRVDSKVKNLIRGVF